MVTILLPPILLWGYLLLVDQQFPLISLPGLLCILLIGLAAWAGIDAIMDLKKIKPNRNLLQYQKTMAVAVAPTSPIGTDEEDETDTADTTK